MATHHKAGGLLTFKWQVEKQHEPKFLRGKPEPATSRLLSRLAIHRNTELRGWFFSQDERHPNTSTARLTTNYTPDATPMEEGATRNWPRRYLKYQPLTGQTNLE